MRSDPRKGEPSKYIATLSAAAYAFTPVLVAGGNVQQIFNINDRGQTVVNTDLSSGIFHRGTFTRLPPAPSSFQVTPLGIKNAGVITGTAIDATGTLEQGFILRGTSYTFFSRPGWDNISPRAIANSGLITGFSFNSTTRAFAGFISTPTRTPSPTRRRPDPHGRWCTG
jgi:hypothetical protein